MSSSSMWLAEILKRLKSLKKSSNYLDILAALEILLVVFNRIGDALILDRRVFVQPQVLRNDLHRVEHSGNYNFDRDAESRETSLLVKHRQAIDGFFLLHWIDNDFLTKRRFCQQMENRKISVS